MFKFGKQVTKSDYPTFPNPAGIGSGLGYEPRTPAVQPQLAESPQNSWGPQHLTPASQAPAPAPDSAWNRTPWG